MKHLSFKALLSCGALLIAAQAFAAAQGAGETYRARLSVVPLTAPQWKAVLDRARR
jgi:hypothetical protein